jgi:hypothetical protein
MCEHLRAIPGGHVQQCDARVLRPSGRLAVYTSGAGQVSELNAIARLLAGAPPNPGRLGTPSDHKIIYETDH